MKVLARNCAPLANCATKPTICKQNESNSNNDNRKPIKPYPNDATRIPAKNEIYIYIYIYIYETPNKTNETQTRCNQS